MITMNKENKTLIQNEWDFLGFPLVFLFIMSCNNFVDCLDIIIYVTRVKLECESEKDIISHTNYQTS